MPDFFNKYRELRERKNSILCIGLDPAIPLQRPKNTMQQKYMDQANGDTTEARLQFCFDIIKQTAHFAIAAKPNEQYVRGLSDKQLRRLADFIRQNDLISIYDCKLGDIGDTAESNLFWMHEWGYDAITAHTQPGNLGQITTLAHSYSPQIGIFALTLMSNPEAVKYMKESRFKEKPVYLAIAEDVHQTETDGCVVGATGHVTVDEIKSIRQKAGLNTVFLIPGVGAQKGDPEKVIIAGGENILINVGRDIMYSDDCKSLAENYCNLFNELRA